MKCLGKEGSTWLGVRDSNSRNAFLSSKLKNAQRLFLSSLFGSFWHGRGTGVRLLVAVTVIVMGMTICAFQVFAITILHSSWPMHPQLSDRRLSLQLFPCTVFSFDLMLLVCKEFIEALETCHSSTWLRLTGGCNVQKDALNTCLRKEVSTSLFIGGQAQRLESYQRFERSAKNREKAKEKRLRIEQGWKELQQEWPCQSDL
jgi:COX assembly protein 2